MTTTANPFITMSIEVTPAQAIEIARLLSPAASPVPVPVPAPVQPAPPMPAAAPVPAPSFNQPVVTQMPAVPTAPVPPAPPNYPAPVPPLAAAPVAPPAGPVIPAAPVPAAVPTAEKKYTMDELSLAARPIVEAGKKDDVLALMHSFEFIGPDGLPKPVQSIRELPEACYPAFAAEIRRMGGRI